MCIISTFRTACCCCMEIPILLLASSFNFALEGVFNCCLDGFGYDDAMHVKWMFLLACVFYFFLCKKRIFRRCIIMKNEMCTKFKSCPFAQTFAHK